MNLPLFPERSSEGFEFRNALADYDDVPAKVVFEGSDKRRPEVSICIPTFRRLDTLVEAVRSALDQRFDRPFEIIVVDNDPESRDAEGLLELVPELASASFRYFVNGENVGMYGNHNLCLRFARAEWVSILHDDDWLKPDFLAILFAEIDQDPSIDGIACRKRFIDQRVQVEESAPATSLMPQFMSPRLLWAYLRGGSNSRRELTGRVVRRLLFERNFLGKQSRRLPVRKFFWAPIPGNICGFVFRKTAAVEIGGFYPEEMPSSDHGFYIRFALLFHIREHRTELAQIRISANESGKVSNALLALKVGIDMQRRMASTTAPGWWLYLTPLLMACVRGEYRNHWRADVPLEDAEKVLGFRLPKERPRLMFAIRVLLNSW